MNLGQHFLVNEETIKRFVSYVDLSFRPIIEIGGGKGNITKYIKPDVVIEIDKRFSSYLRNLVIADARFLPVIRGQIVSSLPYYITYEFFEEIMRIDQIKKLILILQYDFAKKILNEPTYISFILNYYYKIDVKENIPPWFFKPKPRVYSTIVLFTRIRSYDEKINLILKCISKYKNKKIANAIKLCNLSSSLSTNINKRVRDFKPCQVLELLNIISTKYV